MEEGSTYLKPHILPPLGVKATGETGKTGYLNSVTDKLSRQRIGTPAPCKRSPIPEDLDLDNIDVKNGNPMIKVETVKMNETRKHKSFILPEKGTISFSENIFGVNNMNIRKKPQLQPIVNLGIFKKGDGEANMNDVRKRMYGQNILDDATKEKIHLPKKYTPLKPIQGKNSDEHTG